MSKDREKRLREKKNYFDKYLAKECVVEELGFTQNTFGGYSACTTIALCLCKFVSDKVTASLNKRFMGGYDETEYERGPNTIEKNFVDIDKQNIKQVVKEASKYWSINIGHMESVDASQGYTVFTVYGEEKNNVIRTDKETDMEHNIIYMEYLDTIPSYEKELNELLINFRPSCSVDMKLKRLYLHCYRRDPHRSGNRRTFPDDIPCTCVLTYKGKSIFICIRPDGSCYLVNTHGCIAGSLGMPPHDEVSFDPKKLTGVKVSFRNSFLLNRYLMFYFDRVVSPEHVYQDPNIHAELHLVRIHN